MGIQQSNENKQIDMKRTKLRQDFFESSFEYKKN